MGITFPKKKRRNHLQDCNHHQSLLNSKDLSNLIVRPTDAEIIDIYTSDNNDQNENRFRYIHSCVRKNKGLVGKITENLQNKHIFSNDEPENTHTVELTPEDYDMDYKSIYLQTIDGQFLHAYWIRQHEEIDQVMTVLYLHGAGGNISHRLEVLRLFYDNLHCNILIIDYRGFGKSSGSPSELGLYIDAQTAYDYLIYKEKIAPERIIVLGTSLGASVAIQLVSNPLNRVKLVIIENAFTSVPEVAKYLLKYGKNILNRTKSVGFLYLFDSFTKVHRIECPCLYLTGLLDPIIPSWMSKTLYNETRLSSKSQLIEYPYGKHNDLPIMIGYFENIQLFLNSLCSQMNNLSVLN